MEKLSRSINNYFSLHGFNFGGFSSSENWVGFFERKDRFSFDLLDEAINLFEDFFSESHDDIVIITALAFDDEREKNQDILKRYSETYTYFKKQNVLTPITDEYEKYLYGDSTLPANVLNFYFDKEIYIELAKLIMCYSGVVGDICFYINRKLNIAVYPHEDTGFGCISLTNDKREALRFLESCKKNNSFNVVINEI